MSTACQVSNCNTPQKIAVGVGVLDGPLDVCRLMTKDVLAHVKHLEANYSGGVRAVTIACNTSAFKVRQA
eukprot:1217764-Pleurochrysis_carterae.AAC.2